MILLQYHARPKDKPVNPDDIAGAYINCWMNYDIQNEAERKAKEMMDENGWIDLTLDEVSTVNRSDYEDNEDELQYFDQALIDNEVLVVYTYPLVDKEENER
jgi:hypothetical protein